MTQANDTEITLENTTPQNHTLSNVLQSRIIREGTRPAKEFVFNPLNFRGHPETQRAAGRGSLQQLGWIQRVIVNIRTGHLLDGELRVSEAQAMNPNEPVPFIEVDLSEEEERLALTYLDPISGMASIRDDRLKELLKANKNNFTPATQPITAWLKEELRKQRKRQAEFILKDSDVNKEKAVDLQAKWDVQKNSVFQIGPHKLACVDSQKLVNLYDLLDKQTADLIFTSPPYNAKITVDAHDHRVTPKYLDHNDALPPHDFQHFLQTFLDNALKVAHFAFVNIQILANNKVALLNFMAENANTLADILIWDKLHGQPALAHNVTNSQFEFVLVFSQSGKRNIGTREFHGSVSNVYAHSRNQANNPYHLIHKAVFPLHLPTYFIETFSNPNDIILDPFGGIGTTLIAAQNTNRRAYLAEIEPLYAAAALERFAATFPDVPINKIW